MLLQRDRFYVFLLYAVFFFFFSNDDLLYAVGSVFNYYKIILTFTKTVSNKF